MATLPLTKWAVAVGGLALSLSAGAGAASADPIIDTTCNYGQVMAALNANDPAAAAEFNSSPTAQSMLRRFLASPPAQRQQMAQQLQGIPAAQQYLGTIQAVAGTCNNY
ncbi:MAG: hemophore-related protein [Mycobacterium sp.]|nr:hemophore-related protein [Mycobacterium sp.]